MHFSSFLSYLQLHINFFFEIDYFNTADRVLLWSSTLSIFCRMQKRTCLLSKSYSSIYGKFILSANVEVDLCPNVSFATLDFLDLENTITTVFSWQARLWLLTLGSPILVNGEEFQNIEIHTTSEKRRDHQKMVLIDQNRNTAKMSTGN